ncbi:hypothetical protein F4782DRAFT_256410 [Xylaria castorea]|nr:hypothetical protein F4782DRAFT_256410 [Xylaria castorea]
MDVIITGATGFIGGAVVRQAIASDIIRHAFILTRNPLPDDVSNHSKATVIQHNDFFTYPLALLEQLAGCEACIWCVGRHAYQFSNKGTAKMVSVDFPLAAAAAFMINLTPRLQYSEKFRFVFVSGKYAEWDDEKPLFFMRDTRRMKGAAEKRLLSLAAMSQSRLEVSIVRGAGIIATRGGWLKSKLARIAGFIAVDDFAYELVLISAETGGPEIFEMKELLQYVN